MGTALIRPRVGDIVLVNRLNTIRVGHIFADDQEQQLPFLVRFDDGLDPELCWCEAEEVKKLEHCEKEFREYCCREEDHQCPICFAVFDEQEADCRVVTPCGHTFCRECIERALAACQTGDPTERPCPICRQTVSLFSLQMATTGQRIHFLSADLSALEGSVFVLRSHGEVGFASFHFEGTTAYISHSSMRCRWAGLVLDNGTRPPERQFLEKTFWHEGSRTFHGELTWSPDTWYGAERWRVVMQFSADFTYVTTGVMKLRSHKNACLLDGLWRVEYPSESGRSPVVIRVQGGMWEMRGSRYWLTLTDPSKPCFVWRGLGVVQTCQMPPTALAEGDCLLWTTTDTEMPQITWRKLQGPHDRYDRIVFYKLLGPNGFEYVKHQELQGFRPKQLFGNSFMQDLEVGVESFHFEELREDQVVRGYISYERMPKERQEPMENGAPAPVRVPFEKTDWNKESRTFIAEVDFLRHYSSTWRGVSTATYKIVFDPDFLYIESGFVKSTRPTLGSTQQSFGQDLIYVNAAAGPYLRSQGESWRRALRGRVVPKRILESLELVVEAS
ncbi:unnamed protein product [Durusdinium trenchii]|uniref:Uncharacterized protein n=2 Tax=Durusdinium trenchii TaxID=1381693 RepID=A0ABP0SPL0_9DINO